jgi:predicted P-loop ATPase
MTPPVDEPDMLAITRNLVARGFSVIPLDHPDDTSETDPSKIGKTPVIKWKALQERRPTDADLVLWFGNGKKRNAAVVTGAISDLIIVDGDSDEGLAWMRVHLPPTPMRTKTSRDREHWAYRHPGVPVKNKVRIKTGDPAIKIDVRGDGGYAVTIGSLHRTRVTYLPIGEWPSVSDLPVFDPAWLEAEVADTDSETSSKTKTPPSSLPEGERHHELFHEGCRLRYRGYTEPEIVDALWSLLTHRNEGPTVPKANIEALAKDICRRYAQGQTDFVKYTKPKGRKGEIIENHQGNVRLALQRLGLDLSYNAFAVKDLATYDGRTQILDDPVVQRAWLQIDEIFGFRPSLHGFFEIVVRDTARRFSFHPVHDYLDRLEWDGESRINTWLTTYAGAEDTAPDSSEEQSYLEAVSSIFLIGAVRRVRQPGCKFDEMLVLEAPQGTLKSSALRVLCPDDNWFSDDLPLGVSAKEIIERTAGKWIIEATELHGYSNAQVDHLKGMMSRQVDGPVRLAYGRFSVEVPRQFLQIGTTNKLTEYLRDSTGARRFWPVRIKQFNVDALKRDRDQLWAEAAHREANNASIRLPERLWKAAGIEQDARRMVDPWEEIFHERLDFTTDAMLVEDLWNALGDAGKFYKRNDAERIAQIMQRYGFTRKKKIDVVFITVNDKGVETTQDLKRYVWLREGTDTDRVEVRREKEPM